MTVASEVSRSGPYTGNGVTVVFDYEFRILDEAHIRVVREEGGIETVLALGTDYTVSDVGFLAGSITTAVAPTADQTITILRDVPFTQETDLENQGAYYAETVEAALDQAAMRDQQLAEKLGRAVLLPAWGGGDYDAEQLVSDVMQVAADRAAAQTARIAAEGAAAALGNQVHQYDILAQAVAANIPPGVNYVRIVGVDALYKKVGAQPTHSNKFQSSDGAWWELVATVVVRKGKPRSGLVPANHSTTPNTKLVFPPGFIADKDNTLDIVFLTGLVKTTAAWAAGNDAGMMDSASAIAANSGYWLHAIYNPTTQASDILASFSADNPVLPAGWTVRARLPWSFMTDASGFIYPARWYANGYMELKLGPTVAANRSLAFMSLLFLQTPIGGKLKVKVLVTLSNTVDAGNPAFYLFFRDPDLGPPSSPSQASAYKPVGLFDGLVIEGFASAAGEVYTGSSAADGDNTASIVLLGYTDLGDEFA